MFYTYKAVSGRGTAFVYETFLNEACTRAASILVHANQ